MASRVASSFVPVAAHHVRPAVQQARRAPRRAGSPPAMTRPTVPILNAVGALDVTSGDALGEAVADEDRHAHGGEELLHLWTNRAPPQARMCPCTHCLADGLEDELVRDRALAAQQQARGAARAVRVLVVAADLQRPRSQRASPATRRPSGAQSRTPSRTASVPTP